MTVDEFISQFNSDSKDFISSLFFEQERDASYLNNLRSDFKSRFLEPLANEVKKIRPKDIKKIFDPLGISDISDDLEKDFKNYRKKIKEFLDIDIPNLQDSENRENQIKRSTMVEVGNIPEKIKEVDVTSETIKEQKTFGPDIKTIAFSDDSKGFLIELIDRITSDGEKKHLASEKMFSKYFDDSLKNQEELINATNASGFLATIGKILAIGGIAALVINAFWDSHIKPWLEKKFDINLDFLDKFEGLVEGMSKFFTMGGLKITFGPLLSIVGNTLKSFGELIEKGLTWVFQGLFGGAGDDLAKGGAEAAAKSGIFKNFLPKLAGGLFKGLGMVALKGIPVIGSLISFYFAYDRFQSNDYVGAVIDLVGGLANLLSFTPLAPLALPISLGAAALNAFLDYKTAGQPNQNNAKLGMLGNMGMGLYNTMKKIPFIGGLIQSVEGLWKFVSGVIGGDVTGVKAGLELMTSFPLLGVLPSILLAFFDTTDSSNFGDNGTTMNLSNFLQNFKKRVGQTVLSWFGWLPTSWQKSIADFMGVPFEGTGEDAMMDLSSPESQKTRMTQIKETDVDQENIDIVLKNRDIALKEYEEAVRKRDEEDSILGKYVTGKYETYEKMANNLAQEVQVLNEKILEYQKVNSEFTEDDYKRGVADSFNQVADEMKKLNERTTQESPAVSKVNDFVIYNPNKNKAYEPAANDEIMGLKPDGVLDKALKEIKTIANDINQGIMFLNENMKKVSEKPIPAPQPLNITAGSNTQTTNYLLEPTRDPIFDFRSKWWASSERLKATL